MNLRNREGARLAARTALARGRAFQRRDLAAPEKGGAFRLRENPAAENQQPTRHVTLMRTRKKRLLESAILEECSPVYSWRWPR
ncbi:MAG: hypothetical protein PHY12_13150 [Eubacteriales bacterium]|nr:hypothetical protein [Eubacteriales bacterium]